MAKGKAHSDEVRAQVIAALLTGQGVTEVAEQYRLPHSTVSRLKSQIQDKLDELGRKKKRDFGEKLAEYLEANLNALTAQAKAVSDPAYIKKQAAHELATLHGVMADKGIRLLEAASRFGDDEGTAST
jgi:transposase-like protein